MPIHFERFHFFMKDRVAGDVNSTLVITVERSGIDTSFLKFTQKNAYPNSFVGVVCQGSVFTFTRDLLVEGCLHDPHEIGVLPRRKRKAEVEIRSSISRA